jgi:hypothetical protein
MSTRSARLLSWAPRILGLLFSAFLGLFALDAFTHGSPLLKSVDRLLVHLIPACVLLALVAGSWRRPWIGGVGFIVLAIAYSITVWGRVDWILVIAVPAFIVGLLFFWSWRTLPSRNGANG